MDAPSCQVAGVHRVTVKESISSIRGSSSLLVIIIELDRTVLVVVTICHVVVAVVQLGTLGLNYSILVCSAFPLSFVVGSYLISILNSLLFG